MYIPNDTISAVATPVGEGGLGVIRISGNGAIECADSIFHSKSGKSAADFLSHTAHYGYVKDPSSGEVVDDCIVTVFRSPNSYTGEDTVEISCHGGKATLGRTLELTLKAGARLAEPGEFTKRAFMNGKLDLAQAEAVLDIIRAKTNESLKVARRQIDGFLSSSVRNIREAIIRLLAEIEASIDFPDDVDEPSKEYIKNLLNEQTADIEMLLASADKGRIYRDGIQAVIIGSPNVGKSSLLNALLRESRAIVTPIPGTTRDVIEEQINIKGVPVKTIDTAGIRETDDIVEKIGVDRTRISAEHADILLFMIDAEAGFSDNDKSIISQYINNKIILVINKTDKISDTEISQVHNMVKCWIESEMNKEDLPVILTSILNNEGILELEDAIVDMVLSNNISASDEVMVSNIRHKNALMQSLVSLNHAIETVDSDLPIDLVSIDVKSAIEELGGITGDNVAEDVIDRIFSEFCIGK